MEKNKNNRKQLFNRMVEMIKESQYRLSVIFIALIGLIFLLYLFFMVNQNLSWQIFKNWFNYFIFVVVVYFIYSVRKLIRGVWEQTDIGDGINKETKIKLELENLQKIKELQKDFDKFNISKHIQEKIKQNK